MRNDKGVAPERTLLNFEKAATRYFAFLGDLGFELSTSLPTIVRYKRGDLELDIYHGRKSFEVGLEVGHGDERFSLSELIRSIDPPAGDRYRHPAATTAHGLASALDQTANLLRRYGERALRDDAQYFGELRRQRRAWSEDYALDVLAEQTRPKAEAAFRKRRFREAAELYEAIASRLTPAEQQKMAIARRRAG